MLAPIITKDMRLFPTQRVPVKNIRSRAQSLEQLQKAQKLGASKKETRPASTTPVRSLPSPPKSTMSRKSTLAAIQEGVESTEPSSSHRILSLSQSESTNVHAKISFKKVSKSTSAVDQEENDNESDVTEETDKKGGMLKRLVNSFRKSSRNKNLDTQSTSSG